MSIKTNGTAGSQLTLLTPATALVATHTWMGWFKQTAGDIQVPVSFDSGGGSLFEQFYTNGPVWFFFTDLGGGVDNSVGGSPSEFTFLAFARVGDASTGTIDVYTGNGGALTATNFSVHSSSQGTDMTHFGVGSTSSFAFDGIGVGIRYWNGVALTADEIGIEYRRLSPLVQLGSLYQYLPCLNNASPGTDMSGSGHNATVVNTFTTNRTMPPIPYGTPSLLAK
jgi:hypothetical protein